MTASAPSEERPLAARWGRRRSGATLRSGDSLWGNGRTGEKNGSTCLLCVAQRKRKGPYLTGPSAV